MTSLAKLPQPLGQPLNTKDQMVRTMQDGDDVNIKEVQMVLKKVDKGKGKAQQINLPESESEEQGHLRQCIKPSNGLGLARSHGCLAGRS